MDLAGGEIKRGSEGREGEKQGEKAAAAGGSSSLELASSVDDVLYLPPVAASFAAGAAALAREALAAGVPVVVHTLVGQAVPPGDREPDRTALSLPTQPSNDESSSPSVPAASRSDAATSDLLVAVDLLDPLLRVDLETLARFPAGAVAVWPLVPGITDDPALWEDGCARLAAGGVRHAQAMTVRLSSEDRRWLADSVPGASFDALFHRQAPAERAFDRVAHRHGLAPFPPRPLPGRPRLLRSNRRLAGTLAMAAELWLRVGRPVGQGEALYRAARFADRSEHDLEALAREGNLGLLDWLDSSGRAVIMETAEAGASSLVSELLAEYLEAPLPDPSLRSG